ncbi:hypothetical protein KC721_04320, partial [Candidatus Woesebacteria bacterium]|nr:hypothetical protein [Candidatus Woesebacteria bacterium]
MNEILNYLNIGGAHKEKEKSELHAEEAEAYERYKKLRSQFGVSENQPYNALVKKRTLDISSYIKFHIQETAASTPAETDEASFEDEIASEEGLISHLHSALGEGYKASRQEHVQKLTELGVAYADKVLRVYERGLVFARNGAYKLEFDQETIDSELAKTISYDLDQMYAFLESEQSINFLGKCENFPLAYDRARELFGKNANKLDAQDKKTPALLNLLAGVPQETYQKNLSVIKQYSFLYPPVAEGTFIEFSTPYIEILMNGITESEQMTFNAVMKIGKILGDKKLVGHPIVSKGPKEILASEEDILNELETLEVLIYSLKDNPDLLAAVMEDPSTVYSNLKSLRGVAFWQDFVAILVKLSADGWGVNVEDAYDLLKADRSGKNRVDSICGNIRKSNWANSRLFDAEQREYWLFLQDIRSQERAEQNIISIDEVAMLQSFIRPDTSNLFFNITEIIIRNTEDPFQRKDVFNLLCEQKDGLGFGIHVDEVSAYLDSIDEKTADEVDARFIKVWQHCQNKGILNVVFFPEFLFSVMNRVDELFDANNEPLYLLYFEFLQYVKSLPLDSTSLFKTIQDTVLSKEEPFTELSKLVTDNVDTQFLENLQLYVRVIEIFKE